MGQIVSPFLPRAWFSPDSANRFRAFSNQTRRQRPFHRSAPPRWHCRKTPHPPRPSRPQSLPQTLGAQLRAPEPSPAAQLPARSRPLPASWEREYRDLESAVKLRNYSARTLEAYRFWVGRFQAFVRSRPTAKLSNQEVRGFLSSLAVQHSASASSQNQAFNSLLFFFRHVLRRDFGEIDGVVRAKRHRYIPVVLSRREVGAVLGQLPPPYHLVVSLLYGCGLGQSPDT